MNNGKTRKLAITALLVVLTFVLGLTPIGYIPNPILPVLSLTFMCLPVIIGTITEGLKTGLILGLVFGVTSFLKALGITLAPDPLGTLILGISVIKTMAVIFIPRLIIPVTTWLIYKAIERESKRSRRVAAGVAAFVGSVTNTVLFLGALYLLFLPQVSDIAGFLSGMSSVVGFDVTADTLFGLYAVLAGLNGLPEAVIAVLLCVPVVWAVQKQKNKKLPA
jgi:uncharacterized membrane protein